MRDAARRIMRMAGAALLAAGLGSAGADEWRTVSSLVGASKYEAGFARYDYVNPDAPKGGTLNAVAQGTFDSFNPFITRGTAAAGFAAFGGGLLYETLMGQSTEEPGTSYPQIAEAFRYPDDYSSATYRIDPRAKWHDGTPITAEDVIWSLEVLKANSPMYNRYFHNVTEAVALSEREVEFRFDEKGNRELPHIMGDLTVLPKHWWEGTDASGKKRDIAQPTLETPLGSGPYRIDSFKAGSEITWSRAPDYWGAALPVNVGRNNFYWAPLRLLQRRRRHVAGLHQGQLPGRALREPLAALGRVLHVPGLRNRRREEAGVPASRRRADAGFCAQHAAGAVPGPAGARGADLGLRLREHEPHAVLRALYAHRQLFRRRRARLLGPAARPRVGDAGAVQDKLPAEVFEREFKLPAYYMLRRRATTCARRSTCSSRPAGRAGTAGWSTQRASSSRSSSSATTRATSASSAPTSPACASSASTPRSASSTPASTSTGSAPSSSTAWSR